MTISHIIRGGCSFGAAARCWVATRGYRVEHDHFIGFRIAKTREWETITVKKHWDAFLILAIFASFVSIPFPPPYPSFSSPFLFYIFLS
jgi:hypothetical protein